MAILKAFNELDGFESTSGVVTNVNSGYAVKAGVNRACIHFRSSNVNNRSFSYFPLSLTEGWVRFYGRPSTNAGGGSSGAYTNTGYVFGLIDELDNNVFGLYNVVNGLYAGSFQNPTTGGTDVAGNRATGNWDFYWRLHPTTGVLRIYYNESLDYEFLGNTMPGASNKIKGFFVAPAGDGNSPSSGGNTNVSSVLGHFIVSTTPTFGGEVYTLEIEAAGTISGWTGDPLLIAGLTPNVADGIKATVNNQTSLFDIREMPALAPGKEINAVILSTWSRYAENAEVKHQAGVVRSGATYAETAVKPVSFPSAGPLQHIMELNPINGLDWTVADINAAEFGIRAKLVL